jgi:amphi-Trp domain-containing protein
VVAFLSQLAKKLTEVQVTIRQNREEITLRIPDQVVLEYKALSENLSPAIIARVESRRE